MRLNGEDLEALKRAFGIAVRDRVGVDYSRLSTFFVGPEAMAHTFLDHVQQQEASVGSADGRSGHRAQDQHRDPSSSAGASTSWVAGPRPLGAGGGPAWRDPSGVAFEPFRDAGPGSGSMSAAAVARDGVDFSGGHGAALTRSWDGARPSLSQAPAFDYPPSTVGGWLRTVCVTLRLMSFLVFADVALAASCGCVVTL